MTASKLFIHTFHREFDDLFVVGLFEPAEGGVWQLADYQARLIAAFIEALRDGSQARGMVPGAEGRALIPISATASAGKDTPWHRFEIQHYRFRMYMNRLLKKFGVSAGDRNEPRAMTSDGTASADTKLQLAS